jgi:hypothetical protein
MKMYSDGVLKADINADGNSYFNGGNVGIGTASPAEKLEVAGKIKITGTANFIDTTRNASSQANYIRFYDSSTSSVEAYLGFTSNNRDFKVNSANGSGTITLQAGGNTAVRISDTGNVGIGTTAPSQKLTVNGTIMSTGASNPQLILQDNTHSDITIKGDSGIFSVTNQGVGQNITMLYNGSVGIGTTTPSNKLDVDGTARFRANTTVDKSFTADMYISSPSGPFGANPGINANVVIPTKFNQITLTFASGLLIGYVCDGEECPVQPENPE